MNIDDYEDFCELWIATQDTMAGGKKLSEAAIEMVFDDLEEYPLDIIRQCLKRHRKTAQFAPTVFDVTSMINESKGNKHLGVEEAWALAQLMFDESNMVIATPEIFSAWCVASDTDKYSAARAFKEKYAALIKTPSYPEWKNYGGCHVQTGGYPLPARLANPERINDLSDPLRIALNSRLALTQAPAMTAEKLIDQAAEKSNVINAQERWANVRASLYAPSPEKSRAELMREHHEAVKEASRLAIAELKRLHPDEFKKPAIEFAESQHVRQESANV